MLTETLPRIVEARAACQAASQKDETTPLLAADHGQSGSDTNGISHVPHQIHAY